MTNISKQAFLLIQLLFWSFFTQAQDTGVFLDKLTERFTGYCKSFPWEEIYVRTDREEYIAGEDIWLKFYLIDRQSGRLSSESSIVYFELLNRENRPVVQKRIKLGSGTGPGSVLLPDTLSSGTYTIRAYTNRMKNFLPSNCFMKEILVFNALTPDTDKFSKHGGTSAVVKPLAKSSVSAPAGFNFRINKNEMNHIELRIETDREFRSQNGSLCYLFIQTHGVIDFKGPVNLSEDVITKTIPSVLSPGINQVAIFNQEGSLIGNRYIYTPLKESGNNSLLIPEKLKKREKVSVDITLGREFYSSENFPNLIVSVAEKSSKFSGDIGDYLVFGSEFGFLHEKLRNSKPGELSKEELEGFLSDIKSNWIDLEAIMSGNLPELKYRHEGLYHYLNGSLIGKESSGTRKDYLFLSVPGKKATFQYARTDSNGSFSFRLPVNEEIRNLIIQPEFLENDISIKMESPYSEVYSQFLTLPDTLDSERLKHIVRQGANYQMRKIYDLGQETKKAESPVFTDGSKRFYGKPDIELTMDDYIKLPVMQEVFFELMPGVFLKNRRSGYEITIADPVEKRIYERPPVLFIDGVVVHDPAVIANLDPETVEKIDAIKERYMVGDYLFFGLVNVITRKGDFSSNVTLPEYAVRLPYRVVEPVKSFNSPDYSDPEKKKSRLPDFRTTLFWDPGVSVDAEGKAHVEFWTSDYDADYTIIVEGLSWDGKPVSVRKNISVR